MIFLVLLVAFDTIIILCLCAYVTELDKRSKSILTLVERTIDALLGIVKKVKENE